MPKPAVEVRGLNKFRRELRTADKTVARELQAELKDVAQNVAREAAVLAPRRTGSMAMAYRGTASGAKAVVRNRVFYSRFIEFGTKTGTPDQHPIGRAVERQEDQIVDKVGDAIDDASRKMGWH